MRINKTLFWKEHKSNKCPREINLSFLMSFSYHWLVFLKLDRSSQFFLEARAEPIFLVNLIFFEYFSQYLRLQLKIRRWCYFLDLFCSLFETLRRISYYYDHSDPSPRDLPVKDRLISFFSLNPQGGWISGMEVEPKDQISQESSKTGTSGPHHDLALITNTKCHHCQPDANTQSWWFPISFPAKPFKIWFPWFEQQEAAEREREILSCSKSTSIYQVCSFSLPTKLIISSCFIPIRGYISSSLFVSIS